MTALPSAAPRSQSFPGLFPQILIATVIGLAIGLFLPGAAPSLKFLSDLFLRLITMLVGPLVFCVVVQGIMNASSLRSVGRIGVKALLYFEGMTVLATILGAVVSFILKPGAHIAAPLGNAAGSVSDVSAHAHALQTQSVGGFLLSLIPKTPAEAFTSGNVLQILAFAILFGCCLSLCPEEAAPVRRFMDGLTAVLFRMMATIMKVAPLGVLSAVAVSTAKFGMGAMGHMIVFLLLYALVILAFIVTVLALVMRLAGLSLPCFLLYLREELAITAATTASDAVLPAIMRKLCAMGVNEEVVGLVIPAGYSFNLDALSVYLGMAIPFLAQATGTPLSIGQFLLLLGVSTLTSKGAHGVPGVALVVLQAALSTEPSIPVASIVLLLSIDWFVGVPRALGNLIGNCVATVVVAAWEGELDVKRARAVLAGQPEA